MSGHDWVELVTAVYGFGWVPLQAWLALCVLAVVCVSTWGAASVLGDLLYRRDLEWLAEHGRVRG